MANPKVNEDGTSEAPEAIVYLAREAVRAFYLSNGQRFQQAMDNLNSAFIELDGIDYRTFGDRD